MANTKKYPFSVYDPSEVGQLVLTRNDQAATEGVEYALQHGITPAGGDAPSERVLLIMVDNQIDFCFEAGNPHGVVGALQVPGALDDTRRTIDWIYRNLGKITDIQFSLDTHLPIQIFSPLYWMDYTNPVNPTMAQPWSTVSADKYGNQFRALFEPEIEVSQGKTIPWNPEYIRRLAQSRTILNQKLTKKDLMLWPIHCLWGTPGYALVPQLYETVLFWSAARAMNPTPLGKGFITFVEHYSILEAEVAFPGEALTTLDLNTMGAFGTYSKIVVVGQAKSHCVLETLFSLINYFSKNASHMLQNLYIMEDCMSPVGGAGSDFDKATAPYYAMFRDNYGVNLVNSTTFNL